ncbi:MAG: hypothetical protein KH031_24140 [Clostridiales bacterium]|nr:hypothetical protein [Clostridiales bacterium]
MEGFIEQFKNIAILPILASLVSIVTYNINNSFIIKDERIIKIREKQLSIYTNLFKTFEDYIIGGKEVDKQLCFSLNDKLCSKISGNYNYLLPDIIRYNKKLTMYLEDENENKNCILTAKCLLKNIKIEYYELLKRLSYSTGGFIKKFMRLSKIGKATYITFCLTSICAPLTYIGAILFEYTRYIIWAYVTTFSLAVWGISFLVLIIIFVLKRHEVFY